MHCQHHAPEPGLPMPFCWLRSAHPSTPMCVPATLEPSYAFLRAENGLMQSLAGVCQQPASDLRSSSPCVLAEDCKPRCSCERYHALQASCTGT